MNAKRLIYLAVAIFVGATESATANMVANGSFESGSFVADPNNVMILLPGSTAISGWNVVNGETGWIKEPNPWRAVASDGDYLVNLAGYDHSPPYGGVSQTIATAVDQAYRLTFDLYAGGWPNWGPSTILVNVDSTQFSFTADWSLAFEWHPFSLDFVAHSPSTAISFVDGSPAHNVSLDNVSVNAVPIPAAGWLFSSVLLSLLGVLNRGKG